MFHGQFFPGQSPQFYGLPAIRGPWHRATFIEIIQRQGATSNLQICLDPADASSYTSGQSWLDRSGNGYDWFRGADGSATATDPTFNGSAGGRSSAEYWSFDGVDYFTYDTTNETWMENLHKTGAAFTIALWWNPQTISAPQLWFSSNSLSSANTGVGYYQNATGGGQIRVCNGSGATFALNNNSAQAGTIGAWQFRLVSVNEAGAAGASYHQLNGTQATFNGAYSSPSAGAATGTYHIGSTHSGATPYASGTFKSCMAVWNRALSQAEGLALFTASRARFGV